MHRLLLLFVLFAGCLFSSPPKVDKSYRQVVSDLHRLSGAMSTYSLDKGVYPERLELITEFYIGENAHFKDPWGNDYLFRVYKKDGNEYVQVASGGSDGHFEGWDQKGVYKNAPPNCGKDVIFDSQDHLVFGPELY